MLAILLCSSPVLIDQVGMYVSALKIELFIQKSCSIHFLIAMGEAVPNWQSPDGSATALLYHDDPVGGERQQQQAEE